MKKFLKIALINILVLAALLAPVEALFFILLRHPAFLGSVPQAIRRCVTNVYLNQDKRKLQFMPDCGQWDPQLGYTLKPGACRFVNREFDTRYEVNSMGVRGSEAGLARPDIVVLGDSFAMGWGVDQDQTFSRVLEKITGKAVLNTGVASYGTAREVLMLSRANLTDCKTCIIQYCGENDFGENENYVQGGLYLETMTRKRYDQVVEQIPKINRWYPGKYLWSWIKTEIHLAGHPNILPAPEKAVDTFLKVLDSKKPYFVNSRIIVLELNEHGHDTGFIAALGKRMAAGQGPDLLKKIMVLDCCAFLSQEDFFMLDGHLNASGHAKVARALSRIVLNQMASGKAGTRGT